MNRTVKITITLSTDSRTAHIGPFFADMRDTTNGANRQMTTRVGTAAILADFINKAHSAASAADVTLSVSDETYRQEFTARGGLIGTAFSD